MPGPGGAPAEVEEVEISPVCDGLPSGGGLVIERCGVADAQAEGGNDEEGMAIEEGVSDEEGPEAGAGVETG